MVGWYNVSLSRMTRPLVKPPALGYIPAEVALGAVEVDAELSPEKVIRELSREGRTVHVRFRAVEARLLRAAVGAFFDLLGLATRAVEEFGDAALLTPPAAA